MNIPNLTEEEFAELFSIIESVADADSRDKEWEGYVISSECYHRSEKILQTLRERGIVK